MKEPQSPLRLHMFLHVIILEYAEGAVNFEDHQRRIAHRVASMFAQSAIELIGRDMLPGHVRSDLRPVVDQKGGRSLNRAAKAPVHPRKIRKKIVQDKQH